ncbi:MAG: PAS domain-containing protein [Chloroflexales bacterium]|nr:PAS domain-containing protein [Chloroflexales bacterium]
MQTEESSPGMPISSPTTSDLLHSILDGTTALIAVIDSQFNFVIFNAVYAAEFARIFGVKIQIGMSLFDAFPASPVDQARIKELWGRALGGEEFTVTHSLGVAEQEQHTYKTTYRPTRNTQGELIGAMCIAYDITEHQHTADMLAARVQQQAAVAALGQRALRLSFLQQIIDDAVATAAQTLQVEYCKVLELLPDADALLLRAGVGWQKGLLGHATVSADPETQAGYTLTCTEPVTFTDLRTEQRFTGSPLLYQHGVISGMSCIIAGQADQPFGVLGVYTATLRTFTQDDVNFLQATANVISAALQRYHIEQTLRSREEQARRNLAELQTVYATAPIGLGFVGPDLHFVNINQVLAEINGVPPEGTIGRTLREVLPDLVDTIEPYYVHVLQTGESIIDIDIHGTTAAVPGIQRDWLASYYPVRDADGTILGVNTVVQDITQRKQVEQELRESEARFRGAFDNAAVGIAHVGLDGTLLRVNQRLCDIVGYTREELLQKTFQDLTHPADLKKDLEHLNAISHGVLTSYRTEKRYFHKNGAIIWINLTVGLQRDVRGEPQYCISVIEDITERKRAEQALVAARRDQAELLAQIEALLANAPVGFAFFDREHRYVRVNETLAAINGLPAANHLYCTPSEIVPDLADFIDAAIEQVFTTGTGIYNVEVAGKTFAMSDIERYWLVSLYPVIDGSTFIYVGVVVIDISERKRSEEALREAKEAAEAADRMKSSFLANMSHEIRTPLTSMIGFASILALQLEGKQRTQAQRIEKSGKRLLETLNAVLTLARLEGGQIDFKWEAISVAEETLAITQIYQPQAEEKGLSLQFMMAPGVANMHAYLDRGAFSSIVQNLIINAIKFTENGQITVAVDVDYDIYPAAREVGHADADYDIYPAAPRAGQVYVRVKDTGIGIEAAFLPHVFDAFRQESTELGYSYGGSGLGLTIVKQLAEKMNGHVTVQSEQGQGSCFTVSFPLAALAPVRPKAAPIAAPVPHPTTQHILLVEDDTDIQSLIAELLADHCKLTIASNAQEALVIVRQKLNTIERSFDAVLLDINLGGGMNGMDLLLTLRTILAYANVPIAALTAYALPNDRERFLQSGFNAYLCKPFTVEELLNLVSQLISIK